MSLPRLSVARPVTASMAILALFLFGIGAWFSLSIDLFPNIDFPVAFIQTPYPGVDPAEMENIVTRKIEDEVNTVENIKRIESHSFEGFSWITVEFLWGTDIDLAAVDLREKVDLAKRKLPRDIEQVVVQKLDINSRPVLDISLGGDYDLKTLRALADREVKPVFERISGVANVEVFGGLQREIRVKCIPARLRATGITLEDVIKAVGADNQNTPVGSIVEGNFKYLVRAEGELPSPDRLAEIVIKTVNGRPVYLGDVARVVDGFKEIESVSRLNGRPAVSLAIKKEAGANPIAISDAARKLVPALEQRYQGRLKVTIANDGSDFIRDSLQMVRENATTGAFLAIIVLWFFLKNVRSTVIIGVSIPLAVVMTFGFMLLRRGMTLNLMTLGGLALGIGMMVDNGIVVLENIYRHLLGRGDAARAEVAVQGADEVWIAILASTLTTVAVFLPIGFVPGVVGEIFINMSLAIVFSLAASFVVAITVVPLLCANALKGQEPLVEWAQSAFRWCYAWVPWARWSEEGRRDSARGAAEITVALVVGAALTVALLLRADLFPEAQGWLAWGVIGAGKWLAWVGKWVVHGLVAVVLAVIGALVPAAQAEAWMKAEAAFAAKLPGFMVAVKLWLAGWRPTVVTGCGMLANALVLMAITLPIAFALGLTVVPLVSGWLRARGETRSDDLVMDTVRVAYRGLLGGLLRRWWLRWGYIGLVGVSFFAVFAIMPPFEFFPKMDRGIFNIKWEMPEGTSIEKTDELSTRIENLVTTLPEVERVIAQTKLAEGNVTVILKPVEQRRRNSTAIIAALRAEIEPMPGFLTVTFSEPKMGGPGGGGKPIQIEVAGDDYEVINRICLDIAGRIASVPGLKDINSGVKQGRPEVKIEFDRERVRDLGKDPVAVADMVRTSVFGKLAGRYKEANEEFDVRVEAIDGAKDEVAKLRALELVLDRDRTVTLEQVAKVYDGRGYSRIRRKNLKRVVAVEADIEGRALAAVVGDIDRILKQIELPPGYSYAFGGEEEERKEAFRNLFIALWAAILLVYMIMASQFESLAQPFVIMFTIPLSVIGVLLALRIYNFAFSITAMIGLIMLAGIVVNNGIILIDYINTRRRAGADKVTAAIESGAVRLRPILMTTLTTVLGMTPLSLGIGAGADFYQALAITVIGGLSFSTFLTLTFIPALYIDIDNLVEWLSGVVRRFV